MDVLGRLWTQRRRNGDGNVSNNQRLTAIVFIIDALKPTGSIKCSIKEDFLSWQIRMITDRISKEYVCPPTPLKIYFLDTSL